MKKFISLLTIALIMFAVFEVSFAGRPAASDNARNWARFTQDSLWIPEGTSDTSAIHTVGYYTSLTMVWWVASDADDSTVRQFYYQGSWDGTNFITIDSLDDDGFAAADTGAWNFDDVSAKAKLFPYLRTIADPTDAPNGSSTYVKLQIIGLE